ncbi:MAG: AAA family ATPase [Arenicella sp.]
MINTLAISNYRSLLNIIIPFGNLTVITGDNGSGKSNLYKALRLLAETAQGGVINSLAKEGGLSSTLWAGPEKISKRMLSGEVKVEPTHHSKASRLRLGFSGEDFGYAISLGFPTPESLGPTAFGLDPEIKRECIWKGDVFKNNRLSIDRSGGLLKSRPDKEWKILSQHANKYESIFIQASDPIHAPQIASLKEHIKSWRFYDNFRTDSEAPARLPQLGTRTPVLHNDGHDLAAALQTIIEVGDVDALHTAIDDAFPGSQLAIDVQPDGRFTISLQQEGLLRPLSGAELSDGTLRYLLLVAAILTPRPPPLMVLNEPETSLHPDLLPALAKLIIQASDTMQIWVVSHASRLISGLEKSDTCHSIHLEKNLGQTQVHGQGMLDEPLWHWPDKKY